MMKSVLGKLKSYFSKTEEARILVCGLEEAGKTTILCGLKWAEVISIIPRPGFMLEILTVQNVRFVSWNVGTGENFEKYRSFAQQHYYPHTVALVFVVDSNDRQRLNEARDELHRLANEHELKYKPVLVLANKQDLDTALPLVELTEQLELDNLPTEHYHIEVTCATEKRGLKQGFDWLLRAVANDELIQPLRDALNFR